MGYFSPIIKEYLTPELGVLRGRVLDIGCGDQPYRKLMTGVETYIAIDWNVRDSLTANQLKNCFVRGSATELPFKNAIFDAVLASQILEHVREPQLFLEEIRRVLVKGGKCILTFPLINPVHEAPFDFTRFTEYGILSLIDKTNFSFEKTIPMGGGWLAVGYLLYHQLCWHGDQCRSQRGKAMLYRLGQLLYKIFQKVDKRWTAYDLTVNYLSVFRKD